MTENWLRGLPRDKRSMAQDEVGSGTEGSQEGPEGACGLSRQFLSSTKGRRDSRAFGLPSLLAEEEQVRGAPGHRAAGPGVRLGHPGKLWSGTQSPAPTVTPRVGSQGASHRRAVAAPPGRGPAGRLHFSPRGRLFHSFCCQRSSPTPPFPGGSTWPAPLGSKSEERLLCRPHPWPSSRWSWKHNSSSIAFTPAWVMLGHAGSSVSQWRKQRFRPLPPISEADPLPPSSEP